MSKSARQERRVLRRNLAPVPRFRNLPSRAFSLKGLAVFLSALAIFIFVTSCSSTGEGSQEAGEGEQVTTTPADFGGQVVFAVNDLPTDWNPASTAWSGPSTTVARTFLDPLVVVNEDGDWSPYLADFTPNGDATEWTLTLQEGVTFHNGDPFDADTVAANIENARSGILLGPPLRSLETVEILDPLTLRLSLNEQHANFPLLFTSQGGYMFAKQTLAEFASGGTLRPIGTGPWRFSVDDGETVVVNRNENYWQKDDNGNTLPYIDRVEFRYEPDPQTRRIDIESENVDILLENTPEAVAAWENGEYPEGFTLVSSGDLTERTYVSLNAQSGPFADKRLREAVTLATNKERIADIASDGFYRPTDGPFSTNSRWHSPSGAPEQDLSRARTLVQEWTFENRGVPPEVELVVSQGVLNLGIGQELDSQWEEVGIQVNLRSYPTQDFIVKLVSGEFDAIEAQQFSAVDPIGDESFWKAETISPEGQIGLNFPRFSSDLVNKALTEARATTDYSTRRAAYATVWTAWANEYPYIFLFNSPNAALSAPRVSGVGELLSTNGTTALPFSWGGTWLTNAYVIS